MAIPGQLSEHFNRSEFACKDDCGFDTVDAELIRWLERVRTFFDRPVVITSGCRCPAHNKAEGGGENSQHLRGRAADFVVQDTPADVVQEYCLQLGIPGIGVYDDFTHIDSRTGYARW